jgi:hypothetical protein
LSVVAIVSDDQKPLVATEGFASEHYGNGAIV